MKIELNKKYRYRNGDPARILCVDAPGPFPVITLNPHGYTNNHLEDGHYYTDKKDSDLDLIEVREPLECWLTVDDHGQIVTGEGVRLCPLGSTRLFREVIE